MKNHMGPRGNNGAELDILPPHSQEAEAGVIGCVLLSPQESIPKIVERFGDGESQVPPFYDTRHQLLWDAILEMDRSGESIDLITLPQRLRDRDQLDSVGGISYISKLCDSVHSSANLPYYLDIVGEKLIERRLLSACHEAASRIREGAQIAAITADLELALSTVHASSNARGDFFKRHSVDSLLDFDASADQSCLLGVSRGVTTRFLCQSGSGWLIGPSGHGKSSLAFQMACCWAAGIAFCGIAPTRPLRILLIQSENDEGDLAEIAQGVMKGLGIDPFQAAELFELVQANLDTVSINTVIGREFCRVLRREVTRFRADIVIVDPLLSYAGVDVSKQDQCTQFLRAWLQPVLCETGAAMIGVHHTGKPAKDPRHAPKTAMDFAYAGIGSSELVNWARMIMTLMPAESDVYTLSMAKRGKRSGATHPDGTPTTTIWLKHARESICWEQLPPPEETAPEAKPGHKDEPPGEPGRPSKVEQIAGMNLFGFLVACKPEGETSNEIAQRLEVWLSKELKIDVGRSTIKKSGGVLSALVANGKLTKNPDAKYIKGPNA